MEISEALAALRARPWIVMLFGIMGVLAGVLTAGPGGATYVSTGQLNVLPPSNVGGLGQISASQLDRYGVAQLNILSSLDTAAAVAEKVGGGLSKAEVRQAAAFDAIPNSDVVTVTATASSKKLAKSIAQGYLDVYLDRADALLQLQRQPDIDRLDNLIVEVQKQLDANDVLIADAMRAYTVGGGTNTAIPDVANVAPTLATKKQLLLTEYNQLNTARAQADYTNAIRSNSFAIQEATEPEASGDTGPLVPALVGGLVGALAGVLAAFLVYAVVDSSLSETAVSTALTLPVMAHIPHERSQSRRPTRNLEPLPPEVSAAVDQMCVPALVQTDGPVRIAIAGARRGAGSTSLALAMASRYADAGHNVVVVDLDVKDQFLTQVYSRTGDLTVAHMVEELTNGVGASRSSRPLSPTANPLISVLGFGESLSASAVLRKNLLNSVVEWGETGADIVIFDLGPVLESTMVRHVAAVSDSVVLGVALTNQSGSQLRSVRRALDPVADRLLTVVTSPAKRPADPRRVGEPSGTAATNGASRSSNGTSNGNGTGGDKTVGGAPATTTSKDAPKASAAAGSGSTSTTRRTGTSSTSRAGKRGTSTKSPNGSTK